MKMFSSLSDKTLIPALINMFMKYHLAWAVGLCWNVSLRLFLWWIVVVHFFIKFLLMYYSGVQKNEATDTVRFIDKAQTNTSSRVLLCWTLPTVAIVFLTILRKQ